MMFTVHTAYEVFDTWFVLVLSLSCAAFASIHALLTKPDPRGAFGWMVICWLFPLGGAILYGLFGINRVRTARGGCVAIGRMRRQRRTAGPPRQSRIA
ncbi:MAG: PLDc N-terminal domain-containing protein [Steroidobacteraceae bacterium]